MFIYDIQCLVIKLNLKNSNKTVNPKELKNNTNNITVSKQI